MDLTVESGEVHGLLGHNGSGKSTLIKILAGYHTPEPGGELIVGDQPVKFPLRPGQFRSLGMSFVHQDLGLIPSLTVVENLRVGQLAGSRHWRFSWAAECRRAEPLFERFGLSIDPRAQLSSLRPWDRALLAIVRATEELRAWRGERLLLVLDEPTAFLPKDGTEKLFTIIRQTVAQGAGVLFVSHDLDEVLGITDRVTVLRDGRVVGTTVTAKTSVPELVEMIIGRRLESLTSQHPATPTSRRQVASIDGLTGGSLHGVSFRVHAGEIIGVTGSRAWIWLRAAALPDIRRTKRNSGQVTLKGKSFQFAAMTPKCS